MDGRYVFYFICIREHSIGRLRRWHSLFSFIVFLLLFFIFVLLTFGGWGGRQVGIRMNVGVNVER